jgi:hypothetical protein
MLNKFMTLCFSTVLIVDTSLAMSLGAKTPRQLNSLADWFGRHPGYNGQREEVRQGQATGFPARSGPRNIPSRSGVSPLRQLHPTCQIPWVLPSFGDTPLSAQRVPNKGTTRSSQSREGAGSGYRTGIPPDPASRPPLRYQGIWRSRLI